MALMAGVSSISSLPLSAEGALHNLAVDRIGGQFLGDIRGLASRADSAGRLVIVSHADQNDRVTGQTSFVNTTPTWVLTVPLGSLAVPLWVDLAQKGSVAGAMIEITQEIDDIAGYASGGTAETHFYVRNGAGFTSSCVVYSTPTVTAGYGVSIAHQSIAPDVDPASADAQIFKYRWDATDPLFLYGPACWKIFTYAGTTGPTWEWSIAFLDLPAGMLT